MTGASVIKCCYAATGMYMMAADAVLRESANASTSLNHETTRRRNTKMSRRVSAAWQAPPASQESASRVRTSAPHAVDRSGSSSAAAREAPRACRSRAHGESVRLDRSAARCRMVRFNRSMNDVFTVDESSECVSASSNRQAAPIHRPSVDPPHAIMAAGLDHLGVERRGTEDPTHNRPVALEAVGDDQEPGDERHPRRDVAHQRQGVPGAASPDDGRRPETRPDLNRREHPRRPPRPPRERADLVGLQLCGDEAGGPAAATLATHDSGPLEPAGDGVPGSRSTRAIAEILTPSTRSVTTVSNVALRCWRR